jgi:hypothetical protein
MYSKTVEEKENSKLSEVESPSVPQSGLLLSPLFFASYNESQVLKGEKLKRIKDIIYKETG